MHPFFEPLTPKEAMLLLTALTVGGREEVDLFELLPKEMSERLIDKAHRLLEIPGEKRVQFMIKEMKQALNSNGLPGLEFIDPSWLVHELNGESPQIVACILVKLPTPIVKSILKRLPNEIREALPSKKIIRQISGEAEQTVRQLFLGRFHPMPLRPAKELSFVDLIFLERSDLLSLISGLGMTELGQAFVSVGPLALKEFCRRLPKDKQEELISATTNASVVSDPAELKSAQRFLSRTQVNFEDPDKFFHKAGLWRLAKSILSEAPIYHQQFAQRLPRGPGIILLEYIEKIKVMEDVTPDLICHFQDSALRKMRALSEQDLIHSSWANHSFQFHNPDIVE